jgi:antitoxin component YwqK of YwqJK toxin-antitoxin module
VKGKRTGPFTAYYESGNPKVQGKYINDMPDGKWITYNPDFKVEKELVYKNGKLENEELYDAEFKKQYLEWEQNKGKYVEPDADENLKKLFGIP